MRPSPSLSLFPAVTSDRWHSPAPDEHQGRLDVEVGVGEHRGAEVAGDEAGDVPCRDTVIVMQDLNS